MMIGKGTTVKPSSALKMKDESSKDMTNKVKKPKLKKKKRLIIRNLSFKVDEDDLKDIFSKFGTVKEAKIPLKEDGKKRGFGFVEFEDTRSLINAMKSMNWKEIHGRKVAVDFAVDKNTYKLKVQALKQEGKDVRVTNDDIKSEVEIKQERISDDEEEEEESEDEDENRLNNFLKDFYSGAEKLTVPQTQEQNISSEESSSDESEEDAEDDSPVPQKKTKQESDDASSSPTKKPLKKESHDVSEGKTVFLRNVSFASSEESLREAMEEYGECVYCLLCKDQFTDHPKGTAFVKFTEKACADKLVKESFGEPGVMVDGRKLNCSYAMSREDVSHMGEDTKKPKDKRNLNLLRVGLIMTNSKESEGVSPSDMTKRAQLETLKKQKLRNVNFFVSDKRLMIHNLPKTYTDEKLRKLLKKAAGRGAVITEARVMKEFKKIDDNGTTLSKGYGFASFSEHEAALKALTELNNNPSIFTSLKRPIVEFSIENKVALLSRERRKEKMQQRNKRRTEEKKERQLKQDISNAEKDTPNTQNKNKKRRNKNKKNNPTDEAKINNTEENEETVTEEISPNTQKNKNKKRRNKNKKNNLIDEAKISNTEENKKTVAEEISPNTQKNKKRKKPQHSRKEKKNSNGKSQQSMSNLVNKFKDKLINKIT